MKTYHLIAILFASAALAGCAKELVAEQEIGHDEGMIPINVSGSIDQVQTKVSAGGFVDGDAVGLYAVNYSEDNTAAGTLAVEGNQADNVKYVFNGTKWTPVKSVYYKNVNTNVDIYLYYPHQGDISDVEAANFEVKKDQSTARTTTALGGYEASDFLWGKGENITPVESAVQIPMYHKLSAVSVTLVEKAGFDDGEFENLEKSVILMNTSRKATINYATGEATKVGDSQLDGIVMCPQTDGSFRAIVIPQSVAAGTRLFSITIGGRTYGFRVDDTTEYLTGKQLNFEINITKKSDGSGVELTLGTAQISDWTQDINSWGGTARQYYVVNVSEAGTLGKTIKAAGKNPDKIKNLKVTGQVTTSDFYFMRDSMAILEAVNMKEAKVVNAQKTGSTTEDLADDIIPYYAFGQKSTLCYFEFPENLTFIGSCAFNETKLAGTIVLPDNIVTIGSCAFQNTLISSVIFPQNLLSIGDNAFYNCSNLSGELKFPPKLKQIGAQAFSTCGGLSGRLILPDELDTIGDNAFYRCGKFEGDLIIPEKVQSVGPYCFSFSTFKGKLILNNVTNFGKNCFQNCWFSGELIIPEGTTEIPSGAFAWNYFSGIVFPTSLRSIYTGDTFSNFGAFSANSRLTGSLIFPEGMISIGAKAFYGCGQINSIEFPSTLTTIGSSAFTRCYYISKILCNSIEPPVVQTEAFGGVAKDNFTVEVPAQSVKSYQSSTGWEDFKRIAAHYDFSVSRERMRALNGTKTNTYTLRAPSGFDWTVEAPDWVTVSPASGTGKTDVTVTVAEMDHPFSGTFTVNEGSYNSVNNKTYTGRAGQVVFTLTGKNYTCALDVEQYDYDYADGYVKTYQTATKGNNGGIDIVFIGDGYDAKDIATGTFLANAEAGYGHLFDVEPYKTYKDYFNVKAVISMSDESGIGTVNTVIDTKFGSYFTQNRIKTPAAEPCFAWAKKADADMDIQKSLTIMMMNTSTYEGICMMYADGSAIACCPVSTEAYPYDYRGIIQHEAGGHGFGKLADEYIYHNAFIQTCSCIDGCDHPQNDNDSQSAYGAFKSLGWYRNLSMSGDAKQVPWSHLIYHANYSDYVDMYEGGYMHSRGVYRSEATSCMNNNIPYYSAISRQAIVERIKEYAGETFDFKDFVANDSDAFGTITKSGFHSFDRTYGVDPLWNRGSEHGSVVYMGEHPDYSKIK